MKNKMLLAIIMISLLVGAGTLRRGHDWGDDFAWYILQAKSIFTGTTEEFMQQSEFTNTQSTTHVGPLAYPWGYPLILVPVYALKGISPLGFKVPGLLFYTGFLVCLYYLMKSRLTPTESLIIVALFAFNPTMLLFEDQILSDIPFLFFSTSALYLMTAENKLGTLKYVLIGAAVFLTTFMRATGILLLGSYLIIEFFKFLKNIKDRGVIKQLILNNFIICIVFTVFWGINLFLLPNGGGSYLSQYNGLTLDVLKEFAVLYFNVFGEFFGDTQGWKYLYYVLLIFTLLGVWTYRKEEKFFIVFTVLWMIVHITYPYWQGARYVFPVLPIFIYFTFQGVKTASASLFKKLPDIGNRLHYGFWVLMIAAFLVNSSMNMAINLQEGRELGGPFDPQSIQVYDYLKENTPAESVIVFFKPRVMILMTERNTIMSMECDRILRGDYLVLSRKVGDNQQIPPEDIKSCDLSLEQVLKNQKFIVYKILN